MFGLIRPLTETFKQDFCFENLSKLLYDTLFRLKYFDFSFDLEDSKF